MTDIDEGIRDAAYVAHDRLMSRSIRDCIRTVPGFAWRWRLVERCCPRTAHLAAWCERYIDEAMDTLTEPD